MRISAFKPVRFNARPTKKKKKIIANFGGPRPKTSPPSTGGGEGGHVRTGVGRVMQLSSRNFPVNHGVYIYIYIRRTCVRVTPALDDDDAYLYTTHMYVSTRQTHSFHFQHHTRAVSACVISSVIIGLTASRRRFPAVAPLRPLAALDAGPGNGMTL